MTRLRILFDADDVAEDLIGNWVLAVNEKYGTAVTPEDVRDWDITKAFPTLTREQIFSVLDENELWENLEAIPGSQSYLQRLFDDGHELYMVTATDYRTCEAKIERMLKLFPFLDSKHNHFDLTAGFIPKTYQCIVTSAETMGKRKSSKYCTEIISNEKNIQKGDQLPKSTDLTKKPAKSASEVPGHEDNILEMTKGSTVQPLQKKGIPSSKKSQETKVEKNLLVSAEAVACRNGVVHPMKLPSQRTLLFDSTHGLVHYFVRPNDEFALNSLELLSADVNLVSFLKTRKQLP